MPSSVISAFNYDNAKHILQIRFVSGKVYNYKEVPETTYLAMKQAFSKGTYFNEFIKDKYEFERVE